MESEKEIFGVQIRRYNNSRYTSKVWSNLKNAKLAVCPTSLYSIETFEDFKKRYEQELDSRFIIMYEDGSIEIQTVLDYYIDYFERNTRDAIILEGLKEYKRNKVKGE